MNRLVLIIAIAALVVNTIPHGASAAGPFNQRLSQDQQIVHALNRLTFGLRPGDVEELRRVGVTKWIELQLHPDQIPENPVLEAKLKPLETLRMDPTQIAKDYAQPQPVMMQAMGMMNNLLPPEDMRKVQTGTAEQRKAVLASLDEEKRRQVLLRIPPQNLDDLPEYKKEAEDARKMQQEQFQMEARRRNPPLADLLNPDQMSIANRGNREQLTALFAYLEPAKRALVAAALPPQVLTDFPELRRQGMRQRQPQQVVSDDLKEGKVYRALYSNRQLEEVLVDFWFNHFNVDEAKNVPQANNSYRMVLASYERDAIRAHVLGHFKELLLATARHPAMLYYLDNWESMAPGGIEVGPFAPNRGNVNGVPNAIIPSALGRQAHGLNENYGREVMELHTLGVNGGYTQNDVIAVARCFTGWTVRESGIRVRSFYARFWRENSTRS